MMTERLVVGDCLDVIGGWDDGCVDLIYCDPPFATGRDFGEFDDRWGSLDEYLDWMRPRLSEMRRVLRPFGSLYVHVDPTASHYLKVELDRIFGRDRFRNEIAWCYPPNGRAPRRGWHRKHDVILYYADDRDGAWNAPYSSMNPDTRKRYNKVDEDGRVFAAMFGRRAYLDGIPGRPVPDWWDDISWIAHKRDERTGYPTQKPVRLLDRIIRASTDPGDVVVDPFCGSGTTMVAAARLGRRWVGVDVNERALDIAERRLRDELGMFAPAVIR